MDILELQENITKIKEEKNAIILAHNYQIIEIQEIADYLGDSLELCKRAQEVENKSKIVFCGVDFMAETASILNPDKTVIIPNLNSKCPMAAMLPLKILSKYKETHPHAPVVLYVNTLAEAKAEADVTCTSSNAAKIVAQMEGDTVLFGPDRNLAWYVSQNVPEKEVIPIPDYGHCYVHRFLGDGSEAMVLKKRYPNAELLVHPECEPELQKKADYILSTGGMYDHCKESNTKTFIIATETGLIERLRREIIGKTFLPAKEGAECSAMKRIDLDNTFKALVNEKPIIKVPKIVTKRARIPIQRMLEMS